MAKPAIPDLTFPGVRFGATETKWDLRALLYRGGAGTFVKDVADRIAHGDLGSPIEDRIPLVEGLHDQFAAKLAGGSSRATIRADIALLRSFYAWVDNAGRTATLHSIEQDYIEYSEHLLHRSRVLRDISALSAYAYAARLGQMLDEVLQLKIGLLAKTRLSRRKGRKHVLGAQADKQNLSNVATFCHLLLDITEALTLEAIRGALPVTIKLRSGQC